MSGRLPVWVMSFLFVVILLVGCESGDDDDGCPTRGNNITWYSYGDLSMYEAGDDSTAWGIVEDCDWAIHGTHEGGYGDTLQITPDVEAVILVWAYNNFYGFRLGPRWEGRTENGAYMGIDSASFLRFHPEFVRMTDDYFEYVADDTEVSAYFVNDRLNVLYVGYYFRP